MASNLRSQHEIEHGKFLAANDAELTWGWGTPAGKVRAKKRADHIIRAAGLRTGQHALELGCGTGMFTSLFAQSGATVTAIDISPELIDIARKQNPTVKFICGRFEDLDSKKQYDSIIGSSVLHHLDIDAALRKCYELLAPAGTVAFAEPNMLNPQVFAERTFLRKKLRYVSPDETAFVRWPLARKLRSVGFADVKIVPFDWLHPAIPESLIPLIEAVGWVLERVPLVREFAGSVLITCRKP